MAGTVDGDHSIAVSLEVTELSIRTFRAAA
jgi:hypothetical protein